MCWDSECCVKIYQEYFGSTELIEDECGHLAQEQHVAKLSVAPLRNKNGPTFCDDEETLSCCDDADSWIFSDTELDHQNANKECQHTREDSSLRSEDSSTEEKRECRSPEVVPFRHRSLKRCHSAGLLLPSTSCEEEASPERDSLRKLPRTSMLGIQATYHYELLRKDPSIDLFGRGRNEMLAAQRRINAEDIENLASVLIETCLANETSTEAAKGHAIAAIAASLNHPRATDTRPRYSSEGTAALFYSASAPTISLLNYVKRFWQYLQVSKYVYVAAVILLDEVHRRDELLALNKLNVHRLFVTAMLVSAKLLEDNTYSNADFAKVGGIPSIGEMNMLELQFLKRLQWNCSISPKALEAYQDLVFHRTPTCSEARIRPDPVCIKSLAQACDELSRC